MNYGKVLVKSEGFNNDHKYPNINQSKNVSKNNNNISKKNKNVSKNVSNNNNNVTSNETSKIKINNTTSNETSKIIIESDASRMLGFGLCRKHFKISVPWAVWDGTNDTTWNWPTKQNVLKSKYSMTNR